MLSTMTTITAAIAATLILLAIGRRLPRDAARSAALGLLASALVLPSAPVEALEIQRVEGDVTVASTETIDESVVAMGETITVEGTIRGDLIAMARRIRVLGIVEGNLVALAQHVEVDGEVRGSIVGFAQMLEARGQANGSLYAFGETVRPTRDSNVLGDATMFASDASANGAVGRDATAFAQRIDINGRVGRDVDAYGDRVVVGSGTSIAGALNVRVPDTDNVDVAASATIGVGTDVQVDESQTNRGRYVAGGLYLRMLLWFGATFVTGLLLFRIAPAYAAVRFDTRTDMAKTLGLGFLYVVIVPVAAVLAAMTIVGLPVAAFAVGLWLAGLFLAKILVAIFVGSTLLSRDTSRVAVRLLAGLAAVFVVISVPFVGGVMNVVLTVAGVGLLVRQAVISHSSEPTTSRVGL